MRSDEKVFGDDWEKFDNDGGRNFLIFKKRFLKVFSIDNLEVPKRNIKFIELVSNEVFDLKVSIHK